jgi:hypothetical protein
MCAVVTAANNAHTFQQLIAEDCANPQTLIDVIEARAVEF